MLFQYFNSRWAPRNAPEPHVFLARNSDSLASHIITCLDFRANWGETRGKFWFLIGVYVARKEPSDSRQIATLRILLVRSRGTTSDHNLGPVLLETVALLPQLEERGAVYAVPGVNLLDERTHEILDVARRARLHELFEIVHKCLPLRLVIPVRVHREARSVAVQ